MHQDRSVRLLTNIMQAAQQPVLDAYQSAWIQARASGDPNSSRSVLVQQAVSVEYAGRLVDATWSHLEAALEKCHFDWNEEALLLLSEVAKASLDAASEALFSEIRRKQGAYADVSAKAEEVVAHRLQVQTMGLIAKLELYVFNRRRQETLNLLAELEARLQSEGQQPDLLPALRNAKREMEAQTPDEGRLKQMLEVLSTSLQGKRPANSPLSQTS